MCYCERPSLSEHVHVKKAKRPHRCAECYETIAIGQSYRRYTSLFDGQWNKYAFCSNCEAAWQTAYAWLDCACEIPIGDVWGSLADANIALLIKHHRPDVQAEG